MAKNSALATLSCCPAIKGQGRDCPGRLGDNGRPPCGSLRRVGDEFASISGLTKGCRRVGLTEEEIARFMAASQAAVTRLESGPIKPFKLYAGAPSRGSSEAASDQVRAANGSDKLLDLTTMCDEVR